MPQLLSILALMIFAVATGSVFVARRARRQTSLRHEAEPAVTAKTRRAADQPVTSVAALSDVVVTITPAPDGTVVTAPRGLHMMDPKAYACDLSGLACECEEFETRLVDFPPGSPLRCCKHLRYLLLESGLATVAEAEAESLWFERGGRIFKWMAPTGKVVFFSLDPTREWINVDPVRKRAIPDTHIYGWSLVDQRWAYGLPPYGLVKAIGAPITELALVHESMRRELGADVEQRWVARAAIREQRAQQRKAAAMAASRQRGILCDICGHAVGQPWGTPVGNEVECPHCGVWLLVKDEKSADAAERVRLIWRYEGDPRPGAPSGLLQIAKDDHDKHLEQMRAECRANTRTWDQFRADGPAIEMAYLAKVEELQHAYKNALHPIAVRMGFVRRRLKRESKTAPIK